MQVDLASLVRVASEAVDASGRGGFVV